MAMARLPSSEFAVVEQLTQELTTIHLDGSGRLDALLPRIRAFLELDSLVVVCPEQRLRGWGIERLEIDNLPNASRFTAALATCLARAPQQFWCFDAISPEGDQRDCVIETISHVGEAAYHASPIYREVLRPLRLDTGRELRALVCDGPRLLAWVGGFHEGAISRSQHDRLAALLPALRRRLAADRALRKHQLTSAALSTALDQLQGAAFVLGPRGEIETLNKSARMRMQLDPAETVEALTSVGTANGQIERMQLAAAGSPPYILATLRRTGEVARCDERVHRAAESWRLTPRQREVLQLVIRGHGNASIAEELEIGARAVELHVSAILDRACVSSRTSLVALVLGALVLA
ncbi:MAG: LuxR C-terminal-related transcriptional regulator [Polyangiales bacterium]